MNKENEKLSFPCLPLMMIEKLIFIGGILLILSSCSGRIILKNISPEEIEWFTEGRLFNRINYNPTTELNPPLILAWKERFFTGVANSPVLTKEAVIIPLLNGEIFSLRLSDGKKIGRIKIGDSAISGLALKNEQLIISLANEKRSVIMYDLSRGRTIWRKKIGIGLTGPTILNDNLYIGNLSNDIYCLNIKNGDNCGQFTTEAPMHTVASSSRNLFVVLDRNGNVYAFEKESKSLKWKEKLVQDVTIDSDAIYTHPIIQNKKVFITTQKGNIYALQLKDGKILWEHSLHKPIYSAASADEFFLYVSSFNGTIYSIDQNEGKIIWSYDTHQLINKEALVLIKGLVVTTLEGKILWLDKQNGTLLWEDQVKGRIISGPIASKSTLLVADDKKWIYAYTNPN